MPKPKLIEYLTSHIHQTIRISSSLHDAAGTLGITPATLKRHLGKFTYLNENGETTPLDYDYMKSIDENTARAKWENHFYDAPMQAGKSDISKRTVADIHRMILKSTSLQDAADKLGVYVVTLKNHLGKFFYQDESGKATPLDYDYMKSLNENTIRERWGDEFYDAPIQAAKIDISKRIVADIHCIILNSASLYDAAGKLGITSKTLKSHLGKFTYLNENGETTPLDYDYMKSLNENTIRERWGNEFYDAPMQAAKLDISKRTVADIHRMILKSTSLQDAAGKLGISDETLKRHLGKFFYINESGQSTPFDYTYMKSIDENTARVKWENHFYDAPMQSGKKIKISKRTMADIHCIILNSTSLYDAAGKLGIYAATLKSHLGKFFYQDESGKATPLDYDYMKSLNENTIRERWGNELYDAPMQAAKIDISKRTVADIHRMILKSTSLQDAACKLGIYAATLKCHLGKFIYLNENGEAIPFDYDYMKSLNENTLRERWGDEFYDAPMQAAKIDISKRTVADIHRMILKSTSLENAANKLGIADTTLKRHLGKFTYFNENGETTPLDYDYMKSLNENTARERWGDEFYDAPMQAAKIDISKRTVADIHCIILKSTSLHDAAGKLGIADTTLKRHLGKFIYLNENGEATPFDYDYIKSLNENTIRERWGDEFYDAPMQAAKIDISKRTVADIHRIILNSTSLEDAAGKLGITDATLRRHLGKFIYPNENGETTPLDYDHMKSLDENTVRERWGNGLHDTPMQEIEANMINSNEASQLASNSPTRPTSPANGKRLYGLFDLSMPSIEKRAKHSPCSEDIYEKATAKDTDEDMDDMLEFILSS